MHVCVCAYTSSILEPAVNGMPLLHLAPVPRGSPRVRGGQNRRGGRQGERRGAHCPPYVWGAATDPLPRLF